MVRYRWLILGHIRLMQLRHAFIHANPNMTKRFLNKVLKNTRAKFYLLLNQFVSGCFTCAPAQGTGSSELKVKIPFSHVMDPPHQSSRIWFCFQNIYTTCTDNNGVSLPPHHIISLFSEQTADYFAWCSDIWVEPIQLFDTLLDFDDNDECKSTDGSLVEKVVCITFTAFGLTYCLFLALSMMLAIISSSIR